MTMRRLVRSEFRKLTTTKMPVAFLGVLFAFAVINAVIVIAGKDMDGSKDFISTGSSFRDIDRAIIVDRHVSRIDQSLCDNGTPVR